MPPLRSTDKHKAAKASAHLREFCLYYHQPRKLAKEASKIKEFQKKKDGTIGKKYLVKWRCCQCGILTENPDMDHKFPVGKAPLWPYEVGELLAYIRKILVPIHEWQCLCKPCHKVKTDEENRERARKRREAKENLRRKENSERKKVGETKVK
jgi:5-methylcytosine-specific restriction endonuclease McrA